MSPLLMSLAALLSVTQAEAPPSPELVDRFIASLPDRQRVMDEIDPAEMERFARLNPGRESDLRPILQAHATCLLPSTQASTDRMLRQVAARLGVANVEALIRFYQGPDLARFGALAEKTDKNPAESAEFERLIGDYPVEAFMEAVHAEGARLFQEESFFTAWAACDARRTEALARANLRSED